MLQLHSYTVTVTVTVTVFNNVCYGLLCWAVACCDDMCTLLFKGAYPRKFHVELFFYLAYRKYFFVGDGAGLGIAHQQM